MSTTNQMKKIDYTVACHTFCLQMEPGSPLWESLIAYAPFETKAAGGEERIFTLTVTSTPNDALPQAPLTPMGRFDSDGACMELFATADGGRVFLIASHQEEMTQGSRLYIAPGYGSATLRLPHNATINQQFFGLTNALMLLYAFSTATLNTLLMHASVIMNKGKAYAFLGCSGTGKSTHSRLWLQYITDSTLLNDDNPVIRIEHGTPIIYGSPWSGKTPCYLNQCQPVGAIVRLSQAPHNAITLLKGVIAYAALAPTVSAMKWERKMADGIHATLTHLVAATPIYHLQCLPNEEAAHLCADTVTPPNAINTLTKEEPCSD